jgi:aminopeptidase N
LLRRWLDGGELPAGIVLDSELVWALVDRLTSLGGDMQLIEDTLRRDPSAAADVHAARARAGLPSEEAKSRAWRLLTQPSPLRAYQLYATASGFFRPHQDGVTAPFASRYFSDLPDTGGFRSGWLLGQVALLAYPRPHSSPQILALADGLLARDDLAAPLRRSVLDETDRLRRAVSSRSQFA